MAASYRLTNYIWSRQTHNSYNYCDTVHRFATVCNHCVNRKAFIYGRIVYNIKKNREKKSKQNRKKRKKIKKNASVWRHCANIFNDSHQYYAF